MSLTKVTYSMIFGAPINVKDYGAVGDGSTDDTDALQSAIDAGNYIYFPDGVYKITKPLNVPSNKRLEGTKNSKINESATAVCMIHKVTNTTDSFGFDAIFACHNNVVDPDYTPKMSSGNVQISNLTLFGNNSDSSLTIGYGGATNNNAYGVFFGAGEGLVLENVTIVNCVDAVHAQAPWLSRLFSVIAYGRIYQGGGTSTVYDSCEAGFNTIEGYCIENASYITMNCCATDNGGYGRYVFDTVSGLTMNSCAVETINEGLRNYQYDGSGMYITFKGGCKALVNSFRAFDYVSPGGAYPTNYISYISATTDDDITIVSDAIQRQLPPSGGTDYASKMLYVNDNAKINIISAGDYFNKNNFFRQSNVTYAGGALYNQIQSTELNTFTPSLYTGTTPTATYIDRKGSYSIDNDVLTITIYMYIISKNGTGDLTIQGLPADLITLPVRFNAAVQNLSSVRNVEGQLETNGTITLYEAGTGTPITDAQVPSPPSVVISINASIVLI